MKKLAVLAFIMPVVLSGCFKDEPTGSVKQKGNSVKITGSNHKKKYGDISKLDITGSGNVICAKYIGYVDITGDDNKIYAQVGSYDETGSGNKTGDYSSCPI